jgi:hypothetical protein
MRARDAHDGARSPYIEALDVGATHVVALSAVSMVAQDGARVAHDGAMVAQDGAMVAHDGARDAHDGAMGAHDGAPLQPVAVG